MKRNRERKVASRAGRILLILGIAGLSGVSMQGQPSQYLEGSALFQQERYPEAIPLLQQARSSDPGNARILEMLGKALYQMEEYAPARDVFLVLETRDPAAGSLHLARTEAMLNHPEQALRHLELYLRSADKLPEPVLMLDPALSRLDTDPRWHTLWAREDWYSPLDRQFQEALFLKDRQEYLEALNLLLALEQSGYRKTEVAYQKALVYKTLGNEKAARSALKIALDNDPRHVDALEELARLEETRGNHKEAVPLYDRLLRQDPVRFPAYLDRAVAKSGAGMAEQALKDVDAYLAYFPEADSAYYLKGRLAYENGKYLESLKAMNIALEMEAGRAEYWLLRGQSHAATNGLRYAARDLSMSLDLDPFQGETWNALAGVALAAGDREEACRCFNMASLYGILEAGQWVERNCAGTK
ncbi:MAG: tetratricopeptide repeat protein [Bacteroidales bacterium]